ncbi:hypothetical protein GCM10010193_67420 [Kitasatospora atroaurantiaca]|uniref:Uncharacterized protein n=1 Tax=Kitasatospora atroaurantiaca TaxID=285545 RepID=A0A561EHX7_9ACTN|nr:hypothetical protein [Kitasatospora atroaurantiaca]TWE15211.1 hypothetical protein FB465_0090 [Kitasatospora atroaurantiaca]
MIFAALIFLALGFAVLCVPAAATAFASVALTTRQARSVRLATLATVATVVAAGWIALLRDTYIWPLAAVVSFAVTITTGATFLARETRAKRRQTVLNWPAPTGPS